jgi:hypothetical protein
VRQIHRLDNGDSNGNMAQLGVTCIPFSHASQNVVMYTTYDKCNKYLSDVYRACSAGSVNQDKVGARMARSLKTVSSWRPADVAKLNSEVIASQPLFEAAMRRVISQYRRDLERAKVTTVDPGVTPGEFVHRVLEKMAPMSDVLNLRYFGPCGFLERLTMVHASIVAALEVMCHAQPEASPRAVTTQGADMLEPGDSVSNSGRLDAEDGPRPEELEPSDSVSNSGRSDDKRARPPSSHASTRTDHTATLRGGGHDSSG